MGRFKIEKGISRVTRVKLQATVDESVAQDLALMGEWSNNDKNYIVNELLRFGLLQDSEFQAYKRSRSATQSAPASSETTASVRQRASVAKDSIATESGSSPRT
jgi:hypothetical protein